MRGLTRKINTLAKALVFVMTLCAVLSCALSPLRAANSYTPVDADIPFSCEKADADGGATYEFVIEPLDAVSPVPKQNTVTISGSGNGAFAVEITEPGTYQYKVYEKKGSNSDIIYDETVYMVTLFVTNDDAGGLEYQVILAKEGMVKPTEVAFVNSAVRKPEKKDPIVKTGDTGSAAKGTACGFLAAGALLLLRASIKRKETEYEE